MRAGRSASPRTHDSVSGVLGGSSHAQRTQPILSAAQSICWLRLHAQAGREYGGGLAGPVGGCPLAQHHEAPTRL
eukprot:322417-Prymnesium_polylepis.1